MPLANQKSYTIEDIYNLPEGARAELIDGSLYMRASPSRVHQEIVGELLGIISRRKMVPAKLMWRRLLSF